MPTIESLAPYYAGVVAFGSLAADPLSRRVARRPFKTKLTDFYRAIPMSLASILACVTYVIDVHRKLVEEDSRAVRAHLADRSLNTLGIVILCGLLLFIQVAVQRGVDPTGDGKGWKCVMFMPFSNLVTLSALVAVVLFIKAG